MIKKLTIKDKIIKETKLVDGVETKYVFSKGVNEGKNFVRVGLEFEEEQGVWYFKNVFPNSKTTKLEKGEIIILKVEERVDGDNTWRDFSFPTATELQEFVLKQ